MLSITSIWFQDALSSQPAILAVRVAPQIPRIYYNGSRVLSDQNIALAAGLKATIFCEVRYGNPPAYIEWLLGEILKKWNKSVDQESITS